MGTGLLCPGVSGAVLALGFVSPASAHRVHSCGGRGRPQVRTSEDALAVSDARGPSWSRSDNLDGLRLESQVQRQKEDGFLLEDEEARGDALGVICCHGSLEKKGR